MALLDWKDPNEIHKFYLARGADATAKILYDNWDEREIVEQGFFTKPDLARKYYELWETRTAWLRAVGFAVAGLVVGYLVAKNL